ncbi:hypothetical protein [Lacrimispora sp.]|uniref:hypothetical protein n=1 Tax=Lacrimispora sp. TaxID=2719234 RepID=UPI0028AB609C|nr:hypothetical protein [Lacrimispora sp.]
MAGRAKEKLERYYIGGKQYIPKKSTLLCVADGNDMFSKAAWNSEKLYRTGKGTFFIVREGADNEEKVGLLDEEKAFEFMDRNTAGIITENYDVVFGVPEEG